MSFRNRPVPDRKHRPRWQDELRTQQLIVAGFALAIAAAIGIFAATAWGDYYEAHLRPVAAVGDVFYDMDDLQGRMAIIGSELQARYLDLQAQLGGIRDPLIQQSQQAIQTAFGTLAPDSTDNLVLERILADTASRYKIRVTDAAVSAEVTRRQTLSERLKLSLISVFALPKDAQPGAVASAADWTRAEAEIKDIVNQIHGGADWAATAKARSADSAASGGGALGWVQADDQVYATYFTEAHGAAVGAIVGPIKDSTGYHILRLEKRQVAGPNTGLTSLLSSAGVSDAMYRDYIRGQLVYQAFSNYFSTSLITTYQPAREVSQIFIAAQQGFPVPQQRVRHFLAQPLPGASDQSKATAAQWAAALARAEAFRALAIKPNADWLALAATSDDAGSATQGGNLGWYDPGSSNFVPEFKTAIAALSVGHISQPVRTQFGYHIIEITATRTTAANQASALVTTLRQHPDQFARLAQEQSDDSTTAAKGGDLGWVIRYQLDKPLTDAIFGMTKANQISDPVQTSTGLYLFKLVDSSPLRWVPAQQLADVRQTGFSRWLAKIRAGAVTWVDPQYAAAPAAA